MPRQPQKPRPLRKVITIAALTGLAYIAHLTRPVVPTAYRGLPDMVAALLVATAVLAAVSPLLNKKATQQ
jgi:hypothetical protein